MDRATRVARGGSSGPAGGRTAASRFHWLGRLAWWASLALLAGCAGEAGRLPWNLEPGAWWLYAVKRETVASVDAQREWRRNEAWRPLAGGGKALVRTHGGGSREFLHETAAGLERVAWVRPSADGRNEWVADGLLLVPGPGGGQAAWDLPGRTRVLERKVDAYGRLFVIDEALTMHWTVAGREDEVTTPAGRFRHCLRLEGRGEGAFKGDRSVTGSRFSVEEVQWHAPGVGLVRLERKERTDGGIIPAGRYHLELIDFGRD